MWVWHKAYVDISQMGAKMDNAVYLQAPCAGGRTDANARIDKEVLPQQNMEESKTAGDPDTQRQMPRVRKGGSRSTP